MLAVQTWLLHPPEDSLPGQSWMFAKALQQCVAGLGIAATTPADHAAD